MSTWYMTEWHNSASAKITPVEILKSTTGSVWIGDRRKSKRSDYQNFFETRELAVAFIKDVWESHRASGQSKADMYTELLTRSI